MGHSTSSGGRARLFWQVSALVLIAAGAGGRKAEAAPGQSDGGLTLDLQGQYSFDNTSPTEGLFGGSDAAGPTLFDKSGGLKPGDGYGIGGKITYQKPGSDWSFALGVRYGRVRGASGNAHISSNTLYYGFYKTFSQSVREKLSETTHYTIDFEVGKDVGVGIFGSGVSTIGAGVRYAHFDSAVTGSFSTSSKYFSSTSFKRSGTFTAKHATDAVGPRIFVQTLSPFPGNSGFSIGAGAGVGVLFGRQTVHTDFHLSSGTYAPDVRSRSRTQTIPTVDGFLQINWSPPKSALSVGVGYRVDAYFTVMDGGFNSGREIDSVEHGPYLDVSVKFP